MHINKFYLKCLNCSQIIESMSDWLESKQHCHQCNKNRVFVEYNNKFSSKFVHSKELEIVCTSIPALILLILSTPSFTLLYAMDEISEPELTLKILGHQWF